MSNHPHEDAKAPSPPPPPPLPPQRQGFVANALARVAQPFGYGSRPTSATGHRSNNPRPSQLSGQRSSSPISSKSTSHKTGIPIAALDVSPDRTHAVLAGHNILKTIQVSETACAEDVNLRASIIAYAATHEASGSAIASTHKDQWVANDVKWSHGQYSTTIATAAANGQIVVYDINRAGLEIARLHEHNRQVHRLGFNPYNGHLMLSGSQDGTVRLWDLRSLSGERSVTTCQSRQRFSGNSEGIRDLRWSPVNGVEFALGTDNGVIQRWDFRNEKTPLLRVSAHEHKTCYSIDWHPDGKHLVSGGADKNIKVWDFSSSDRRKKHVWEIRAPQAVLNVRWRPACWSTGKQSPAKWQSTQIATSYDQEDPRIHIWDFRRPYLPFRTSDRYETPASALLWHSENLLWSVGSAGMFTQTDINFVPKKMDHLSPNLLTIAADGQILYFSQRRERRRRSFEDVLDDLNQHQERQSTTGASARARASTVQSNFEDPNMLSSSFQTRQRKSTSSMRSTRSSTGTPPSSTSTTGQIMDLEESLQPKNMYQPPQVAGIGYIEGLFDASTVRYLARNFKTPQIPTEDTECNLHVIIGDTLRHNSALAEQTGQYRLAQSLQILALAVDIELKARAEKNHQSRMEAATHDKLPEFESLKIAESNDPPATYNSNGPPLDYEQRQAKIIASSIIENASNMTTPLARPIPDTLAAPSAPSTVESLQLPDTKWSKQPVKAVVGISELAKMTSPKPLGKEHSPPQKKLDNEHLASKDESPPVEKSRELRRHEDLADMDRQMAERRAAMSSYRAVPRPLLRLDDPSQSDGSGLNIPKFGRHDSDESFQLFSASTDSSHRLQSIIGSFESTQNSQQTTSSPEHTNIIEQARDSADRGHEESVLVFDDEAQLHSPEDHLDSPSKKPENDKPTETVESWTFCRPANFLRPIIHYEDFEEQHPQAEPPLASTENEISTETHKYLLSDYIPPQRKPDDLRPWAASKLFEPLIDFHTYKLYDAQLPTWLILHLGRWLYHSIPYERAIMIFLQYHRQLVDLDCAVQAAELRNLAAPEFPEVAEHGLYGITLGGPWCTVCQKPSKGKKPCFCERCNQRWADCPICNGRGPISPPDANGVCGYADNTGANGLWSWCQDCGHGGHRICLSIFWDHDEGEGACPTVGCLCDCMPGKRRDEYFAREEKEREKKKPGVVSRDEWKVPESAAAQRARGLMGPAQGLGMGGGRGAMGLAAAGRSASGGKKVRIVVPEDGDECGEKGKGGEKGSASAS